MVSWFLQDHGQGRSATYLVVSRAGGVGDAPKYDGGRVEKVSKTDAATTAEPSTFSRPQTSARVCGPMLKWSLSAEARQQRFNMWKRER